MTGAQIGGSRENVIGSLTGAQIGGSRENLVTVPYFTPTTPQKITRLSLTLS